MWTTFYHEYVDLVVEFARFFPLIVGQREWFPGLQLIILNFRFNEGESVEEYVNRITHLTATDIEFRLGIHKW